MKSSNSLKELKKESSKMKKLSKEFSKNISKLSNNIKEEYNKILEIKMLKLIDRISIGEQLDKEMLINKYLNEDKKLDKEEKNITIYDKVVLDSGTYYKVEGENGCNILDDKGKICGKYENGKYLFSN
jgi:hypothetical protein